MKTQLFRAPKIRRIVTSAAIAVLMMAGFLAGSAPASAGTYLGGVDMQRACNTQWPGLGLRAQVLYPYNAYSWRCTYPTGYRQGIDVNRECVTQYGFGAYAGLWDWRNPYTWYCQR